MVNNWELVQPTQEEDSSAVSIVTKVLSDQREFVQSLKELIEIGTRLTNELAWGEDEDITRTFGSFRQLADLHYDLLDTMARNLFTKPLGRRWSPVFQFYLQNIETETIFIMSELSIKSKIRSLIYSTRGIDGDQTTALLTRCLNILPLVPDRVSVYARYLKRVSLGRMSTAAI